MERGKAEKRKRQGKHPKLGERKKGEVWAGGASLARVSAEGLLAGGLTTGLAIVATVPAQQDGDAGRADAGDKVAGSTLSFLSLG